MGSFLEEETMSKGINQKLKLLYLIRIFLEKTDEMHGLSAQQLISELEKYDIHAERKSIYHDIECLIDYGYDIVNRKAKTGGGYYLASREFELPELKLLVDAVQASRFITTKKSRDLIAKIEKLAGPYEAKKLQRQVVVASRIKAENESIYYNVDSIHHAIQNNVSITFHYLQWNCEKKLVERHEGKTYFASPWALTWKEENYYLVAFDNEDKKIKHFRVDKMSRIEEHPESVREGAESFQQFDIVEYTNRAFGMYGGKMETVSLQLPEKLVGVLIDRFGKETQIRKSGPGMIRARIKVAVSHQFYGWLTGLGKEVTILSPEETRQEYIHYVEGILDQYRK